VSFDTNKASDQAALLLRMCELWGKPKGATAKVIAGMHHLWEEVYKAQDQPRILICCNGEKPRGAFQVSNTLNRVDRKWVVVAIRGHGFKNEILEAGVTGYPPVLDNLEDLRDNVLRVAIQLTMEPPIDYQGWSPVPNLAPAQSANPFLDGSMLEFSTANDIPAILYAPRPTSIGGEVYMSGKVALTPGQTSGSVTGLGLGFTPTKCFPAVTVPDGGDAVDVKVVEGSLSADGFNYLLTGAPGAGYFLEYLLLP
jgi:hypothetical protein